jgi:hypothetical protein
MFSCQIRHHQSQEKVVPPHLGDSQKRWLPNHCRRSQKKWLNVSVSPVVVPLLSMIPTIFGVTTVT